MLNTLQVLVRLPQLLRKLIYPTQYVYSCASDSTLAMITTVACLSLYSAHVQTADMEYVIPELAVLRLLDMVFTRAPLLLKEKLGRAMLRWP